MGGLSAALRRQHRAPVRERVPSQVVFGLPTAKQVGGMKDNDEGNLTSRAALNHDALFVNDTWAVGRAHAERRRPLRPLPRLAARAGAAGGDGRPGVRCPPRPSPRPTSTRGTSSPRASVSSTTSPAMARRCSKPTTGSSGTTPASPSPASPTRTPRRRRYLLLERRQWR